MTDNSKKAKTQCTKILKHMRSHKRGITSMDAFSKYGITRLSGRIWDLRERGFDIETIMEVGKNDDGNTVQYARYVLR